jgi:hypothetical protein
MKAMLGTYSQIVAADFLTPTGRRLNGFMEVTTAKSKIHPGAILGRVGYRLLRARDGLLKALACTEPDVFPLRYEIRVRIEGEKQNRNGTVN